MTDAIDFRQFLNGERTYERFWQMSPRDQSVIWNSLKETEKVTFRDLRCLSPQLRGYEGYRVEVSGEHYKYRFIVGRSTGWKPVHLEIKTKRSHGGGAASKFYDSVKVIERVR
jgi:hypothetical protein